MTFQRDSGVTPDLGTIRVDGKLVGSRALRNTIPGSLKPDPKDPETGTGNFETDTWYTGNGITHDPSQLGGLHKGDRWIFHWVLQSLSLGSFGAPNVFHVRHRP